MKKARLPEGKRASIVKLRSNPPRCSIRATTVREWILLRQLRNRERTAHVPVMVVSAFATDSDMRRYKQSGADASFSKPYDIDELLTCNW